MRGSRSPNSTRGARTIVVTAQTLSYFPSRTVQDLRVFHVKQIEGIKIQRLPHQIASSRHALCAFYKRYRRKG
jgi:hypothetical protein